MLRAKKQQRQNSAPVVDLSKEIAAQTHIPQAYYPALRSGFAGYPPNPRWNGAKFRAWRIGRQWREGLDNGNLVVRESDSLLVRASEA